MWSRQVRTTNAPFPLLYHVRMTNPTAAAIAPCPPCQAPVIWSSARAFCATITAGGTTATDYPTRATAACGTAPAKYLSACARSLTCTPTTSTSAPSPTSTTCLHLGLVPNGDFEYGTTSWTVQVPDSTQTPASSRRGRPEQRPSRSTLNPRLSRRSWRQRTHSQPGHQRRG